MAAQFQLIMRTGPAPGTTYSLEGEQITIGRDSSNAISINDAEVSRRHARLTLQGGKYVLEDFGSTNGTFVNGQRITGQRVLKAGDVLSLGEGISLVFESSTFDPAATVATPRPAVVSRPGPAPAPPPAVPAVVGQVPAGPLPAAPAKKSSAMPIVLVVGALVFLCACGVFFWWVDATYRWCVFFPFIPGCQ